MTTKNFVLPVLLLTLAPVISESASRSDCLAAKGSNITPVCKSAVESGVQDVKVYVALASALNASGKSSQAARYLKQGLRNFPGNSELLSLAKIINANLSESELIQANSGVRQKSVSSASLKISRIRCLSKSGNTAINACRDYLSANANDAEISARLANLTGGGSSAPSQQVAKASPPPAQTNFAQTNQPEAKVAAGPDRALVKDIQRELRSLGYYNSSIDGLPGGGTQRAIDQYYRTVRNANAPQISDAMFSDIADTNAALKIARSHARQAKDLQSQADYGAALSKVQLAKNSAPWSSEFANLERSITSALAQQQEAVQAARMAKQETERVARDQTLREQRQADLQLAIAKTRAQLEVVDRLRSTLQSELNSVLSTIQSSQLTGF